MNNELIEQRSWFQKNKRLVTTLSFILIIAIVIFFTSGLNTVAADITRAYSDEELYRNAVERANADSNVVDLIGNIEPIDKLAIFEGQVNYTDNNKTVNSTVRITGEKSKAKMDISANYIDNQWDYTKINIRLKKSSENENQLIEVSLDD